MSQATSDSGDGRPLVAHRGKRRAERTRAQLLGAARAVFLKRGYDGASLSEITETADLGTGTLYLHFRDKRGLYEELVRHEVSVQRAEWQAACAERGVCDAATAIELMIRVNIDRCLREPDFARLVLCDGPAVETWLTEEIGQEITDILKDQGVPNAELAAHLVVGATLAAGRAAITRRGAPTKPWLDAIAVFCAGGIAAMSARPRKRATEKRP